jgi:predicted DNA-binding antitoxin AbrB/MazE fold protein
VYEGGVLRPVQPLPLAEGEMVDVTVATTRPAAPVLRPPTPEEEAYARCVQEVRSLEELLAVQATAPPLPDGYDLCKALNANRQATGERLLFPEPPEESNP